MHRYWACNRLPYTSSAFDTISWPAEQRALIFSLFAWSGSPADLCRANFALGESFAAAVLAVLHQVGWTPAQVDLIGCHGQTIWHDVQYGRVTSTLQIGEPAVIAARTGATTVGNFRAADVAVGGQGALLVSTFDWDCLRPPAQPQRCVRRWAPCRILAASAT